MNNLAKFVIVMGSTYVSILYPSSIIFGVLIVVNIVDYITGILRAVSIQEKISPSIAMSGIANKLNKLFYVIVALSSDILITYALGQEQGITPISTAVITWLVINELISICGNISNNNSLEIPPMILSFLNKFKED